MINVGRIEISAAIVEIYHVFKRGKVPIVKVWTTQPDVPQTGSAELADVVRVAGDLEASGVFELRAHADVVKLIVAEKTSGMTDIASRLIEDALPASLRRTQGIDLRHVLIEGRA